MNELNIPFGLCSITYGDMQLPFIADEAVFTAIPIYQNMFGGVLNATQNYILIDYQVSFTVSIDSESYNTLKLHMPTLQKHKHGLYDSASNVDMTGKQLVIHPKINDTRDYDICIWEAYISPKTEFKRTFKKDADKFEITFKGKRVNDHNDPNLIESYFFIGDWLKVINNE
ncbi:hypothetical protein ACM26V_16835 [Salipaludibacillus sp. HK11]|uniref:hypothetical protein n=1 Tax=Salipaludibacillus sp. HK11 TaxID=3394320 RepID=UPI0039FD71C1